MTTKHILVATILDVFLIGCSDPKEANEKNFSQAIQHYLNNLEGKGEYCLLSEAHDMPYTCEGIWTAGILGNRSDP